MRRNVELQDNHGPRTGPPPFRVLGVVSPGGRSPSPPPPRAPEPYKIPPPSTSYNRAHRRSSFVIIAEARPATPSSRSSSPTLATGRVSPFRGRGFKGPLPHAQSRPHTPENADGRKLRGRGERRTSVSQQNSPKRSLIPQPTRRRSTSLTKGDERDRVPAKYGRRATTRNQLQVTNDLASSHKPSLKPPDLSPIQGTPTKPADKKSAEKESAKDRLRVERQSFSRSRRNSLLPPKSLPTSRRSSRDKSPAKDRSLIPPSKAPLKRTPGSTRKAGSTSSLISKRPSLKSSNKSATIPRGTRPQQQQQQQSKQQNQRQPQPRNRAPDKSKPDVEEGQQQQTIQQIDPTDSKSSADQEKNQVDSTAYNDDDEDVEELGLMDLLKQSSGANGTSNMVNTTAVTAAQPLHIDTAAILTDIATASPRDATKCVPTGNGSEPASGQGRSENDTSTPKSTASRASKALANDAEASRAKKTDSTRAASDVAARAGHAKTSSLGQPAANVSEASSTDRNASVKSSDPRMRSNGQETVDDAKRRQTSGLPVTRNGNGGPRVQPEADQPATNGKLNGAASELNRARDADVKQGAERGGVGTPSMGHPRSEGGASNSIRTVGGTRSSSNSVATSNGGRGGTMSRMVGNDRGSEASAKSSMGSIGSVRSTDTGVSVNTVRGVSSAREKQGMHLEKRPQEIETLSGNMVHREHENGEPAVLAAERAEEAAPIAEGRLTRWRKTLAHCCGCCPGMRCLACRRGPKGAGQPWPGRTVAAVSNARVDASAMQKPVGCWQKAKAACRCSNRGARVAPSENTACCPPERGCGALCRRMFGGCRRSPDAQRTRSIRAKQSLTSVAAPPLSEEPKAKIPDVLVEHTSVMRGAIPCLPVPLAWFCLLWNVVVPGSGTVFSGIFNLCIGQPRFSNVASLKARFGAFIVNLIVGVGQLFTVLFCLVGWGWSIWWGVTMVRLARKYKRFKVSEAASGDAEARGGEPAALPPGVPSQALRGIERAR